jgi:hypothetical protein
MPANGLIYAPPDACACYNKVKVNGFFAAASRRDEAGRWPEDRTRVIKGPAFGADHGVAATPKDWPMYRKDNRRSGATKASISAEPELRWNTSIAPELTQPIVVGNQVFLASQATDSVYCLDAETGSLEWHFTAGAHIDSAPTYWKGSLFFGSADGWVYCLRCDDGQLKWRYLVAPGVRFTQSNDQLESVWPVHGSVLIVDDVLYAAAGRNSYLDGGIVLCLIDPKSGKEIARKSICHIDPETNRQSVTEPGRGFDMEGVRPDVLSSDGERIYMKHYAFDLDGNRIEQTAPHLFSINSLLDPEWFVRSYWLIGTDVGAGWGNWADVAKSIPSGRILSFTGDDVFGYGRKTVASAAVGHRADEYILWSDDNILSGSDHGQPKKKNAQFRWIDDNSLIVRAMTLASDKLCVAGPPDLGRKSSDLLAFENPEESLHSFLGKKGVFLRVIEAASGKVLSEKRLPSMPVFDGMTAAGDSLFLSLTDGSVQAWE